MGLGGRHPTPWKARDSAVAQLRPEALKGQPAGRACERHSEEASMALPKDRPAWGWRWRGKGEEQTQNQER